MIFNCPLHNVRQPTIRNVLLLSKHTKRKPPYGNGLVISSGQSNESAEFPYNPTKQDSSEFGWRVG